jgi:hypothetical protein
MKRFRLCFLLAAGLALAACGPDDHLHLGQDGGSGSDGGPPAATLTSYVIDLVNNHSSDTSAAPYSAFQSLPDPDGDTNNTAAYSSLFP